MSKKNEMVISCEKCNTIIEEPMNVRAGGVDETYIGGYCTICKDYVGGKVGFKPSDNSGEKS